MLRTDGFSLLEVLVAISIFAIGILAVASMQLTSIQGNAFGNEMTAATFLAQAKLEELKSVSDVTTLADGADNIDVTGAAGGIFNRAWTVVDPAPTSARRRVTVTVTWSSGMGDHIVILRTITRGNGE
jgi:prepilin-type N-terminal cleavage/methylation domain-containing protein